jgi:hypothetical protein
MSVSLGNSASCKVTCVDSPVAVSHSIITGAPYMLQMIYELRLKYCLNPTQTLGKVSLHRLPDMVVNLMYRSAAIVCVWSSRAWWYLAHMYMLQDTCEDTLHDKVLVRYC